MEMILTEEKRAELRARAEGRMKQYGTSAMVKMLCSEVLACVNTVDAMKVQAGARVENAGRAMATAKEERAEAGRLAEEAIAAQNKASEALVKLEAVETELGLLRAVLDAAEAKGRKGLPDSVKAYRSAYPDFDGGDSDSDSDENEGDENPEDINF